MRFADPWLLLLLLLLPIVLYGLWQRRPAALAYSSVQGLAALKPSFATRLRQALPLLRLLVIGLAIVALARPQWGIEATKIFREGIAIAMVVDISSSMAAVDLQIEGQESNRLDVVKRTFRDFVSGETDNNTESDNADSKELSGREGDLIGMFTFARYADALSPLTLDHKALLTLLEQVKIVPLPEEDGTAIGDAIVSGIQGLRRTEGTSRVMILLTDGSNNAGDTDPVKAAQIAQALGIKIYTIGTGTRGIAMMPARLRTGGFEMRPTPVYIDEDTLTAIAELTNGKYFRATDSEALRAIYGEIDRLEKAKNVAENYQQYIEGFPLFLLLALILLSLEIVLLNTRLRTLP